MTADPTQLKSSPDGYLQPPIEWAQLPEQVQQAILRLPPDNWQEAIDMFAFRLWAYKARQMHEGFLSRLRETSIDAGDSLDTIADKTMQHQELLRWHHYSLHPNEDMENRP